MKWFYYWPEKKENIEFKAIDRDTAIRKLMKKTGKPYFWVDRFLKSEEQLSFQPGCLFGRK